MPLPVSLSIAFAAPDTAVAVCMLCWAGDLAPAFMLTGGGLVHSTVAKPLEAQLKRVVAERNGSQTSEDDQLRHKAGAGGQGGGGPAACAPHGVDRYHHHGG